MTKDSMTEVTMTKESMASEKRDVPAEAEPSCTGIEPCESNEPCENPADDPLAHIRRGYTAAGCPAPLAWGDVLRDFQDKATPWTIERPHGRITGRTWGNGPPICFVNGIGGTSDQFALLVWLLRDDFTCIVFNAVGTNEALPIWSPPKLDTLVGDLIAVADKHSAARFDLFATSFGGLIGISAAARFPERIRRLVLAGAFANRRLSVVERLLIRLGCHAFGPARNVRGRISVTKANHRRWFPPRDDGRWQFFLDDTGGVPIRTIAQRAAVIRDTDLRPILPSISQPTLIIRGEGDGVIAGRCAEELASGIPHGRLEWMSNTGHLPHLSSPHRLAKQIRDFFTTDDPLHAPPATAVKWSLASAASR
jgi:pimeloyl-ACP methyl ester carboxylesterase